MTWTMEMLGIPTFKRMSHYIIPWLFSLSRLLPEYPEYPEVMALMSSRRLSGS